MKYANCLNIVHRNSPSCPLESDGACSRAHPYIVQVIADSSREWCGNGLRFATEDEALDYGRDLSSRWTLVRDMRVLNTLEEINA